ncbi:hypothetical protein M758_11G108500, partial [Ceratodon purpureus]
IQVGEEIAGNGKTSLHIAKELPVQKGNSSGGFVFGSAQGCNFFNFSGSFDPSAIATLMTNLPKVESFYSAPLSSQ